MIPEIWNLFFGLLEVMKGLWAKKYGKMKKKQSETETEDKQLERVKQKLGCEIEIPPTRSDKEKTKQVNFFAPINHPNSNF